MATKFARFANMRFLFHVDEKVRSLPFAKNSSGMILLINIIYRSMIWLINQYVAKKLVGHITIPD